MLDFDLRCAQCGYNLRGLSVAARCPECGLPVTSTVESQLPHRQYARIKSGVQLILVAASTGAMWIGVSALVNIPPTLRLAWQIILVVSCCAVWCGIARVTTTRTVRAVFSTACAIGGAAVSVMAGTAYLLCGGVRGIIPGETIGLGILVASGVCLAGVCQYLRVLARYLISERLDVYARDAGVCLPIVTVALLWLAWVGKQKEAVQPGAVFALALVIQIVVLVVLAVVLLLVVRRKVANRDTQEFKP